MSFTKFDLAIKRVHNRCDLLAYEDVFGGVDALFVLSLSVRVVVEYSFNESLLNFCIL